MSVSVGGGGPNSQDFELNLASIIDCFTVLIAFMLASASFLAIGILDAGVAAGGTEAKSDKAPEINLTLELGPDKSFAVKLSGKSSGNYPIKAGPSDWDYDGLTRQLQTIKGKYPDLNAITLTAENSVQYKDVVKAMDVARKVMPAVLLGGF